MSAQRHFDQRANVANVGPMLGRLRADVEATLGRHRADIEPTSGRRCADVFANICRPFLQLFANLLPTFHCYSHIMFHKLYIIFDVLKMSRRYHIPKHILVCVLKHDIPMTSSRHQGIMSVTSQILTLFDRLLLPIYLYTYQIAIRRRANIGNGHQRRQWFANVGLMLANQPIT